VKPYVMNVGGRSALPLIVCALLALWLVTRGNYAVSILSGSTRIELRPPAVR